MRVPGSFLLVALLFMSCNFRVTRDADKAVLHLGADPTTLNPLLSTDAYASQVESRIFDQLFTRDNETLEFKPALATRWDVSEDKLQYTFFLRREVKWHDGHPFTADDVLFTFERIRDPKVDAAVVRQSFRDVKQLEKLDDFTIRVTYTRPYFRGLLVVGAMTILPKHLYEGSTDFNAHPRNRKPIGTGPYRFVSWETGRQIVVERNEIYWGTTPAIKTITFNIIPNATVAFQLLKKGGVDLMGVKSIQWARQTGSEKFQERFAKYRYYLPNYSFIGWNGRHPFFSDARVRRAMTMLIDRKGILEQIEFGEGEIVSGNEYRFGEGYDASIEPYPFNPKEAAQLFDEAGWVDRDGDGIRDRLGIPFRFELLMPAGVDLSRSVGLMLSEELSKLGIEMTLRQLEWTTFIKLMTQRQFDAVILAWAMPLDNDPYQVWHSSQTEEGSNVIGFQHREVDRIIETAQTEFDAKKRKALYRKIHRILHEEQPYTFLFTRPSLVVVHRRFTNVKAYRVGLDMEEWGVGASEELIAW